MLKSLQKSEIRFGRELNENNTVNRSNLVLSGSKLCFNLDHLNGLFLSTGIGKKEKKGTDNTLTSAKIHVRFSRNNKKTTSVYQELTNFQERKVIKNNNECIKCLRPVRCMFKSTK